MNPYSYHHLVNVAKRQVAVGKLELALCLGFEFKVPVFANEPALLNSLIVIMAVTFIYCFVCL